MNANAFWPKSPTVMANLTSAAIAPVQPSTGSFSHYRLVNISTGPAAFIAMGQSTATATLPLSSAASTAAFGFPLLQNQEIVIQGPPNAYFSALTTAATLACVLAITAGEGKR